MLKVSYIFSISLEEVNCFELSHNKAYAIWRRPFSSSEQCDVIKKNVQKFDAMYFAALL